MTNGLIDRSPRLLSIPNRPSSRNTLIPTGSGNTSLLRQARFWARRESAGFPACQKSIQNGATSLHTDLVAFFRCDVLQFTLYREKAVTKLQPFSGSDRCRSLRSGSAFNASSNFLRACPAPHQGDIGHLVVFGVSISSGSYLVYRQSLRTNVSPWICRDRGDVAVQPHSNAHVDNLMDIKMTPDRLRSHQLND